MSKANIMWKCPLCLDLGQFQWEDGYLGIKDFKDRNRPCGVQDFQLAST